MRQLRISPQLSLPAEAVTETVAILAKRGAGKTYTAAVLVEEMLQAKLQVVVVDPMSAWWGLRSSGEDGSGEGFPIAVLGGPRGDVPLEATGGQVVADLVVDERVSAILDLSEFSKTDWRKFVAAFLARLYQRNREPMHVVLEEADLFAPEGRLKRPGDEEMLGAVYDLVRRGRGRGIGSTLITQRSASISKEVLTQAEILIALRTTGPHDRKAIEAWIELHGEKAERDEVLGSLAGLPTGEAWVWWPVEGILRRVKIRERRTFDSSATPKPGQARVEPKTVADVDLAALQERMAATIERAKADDPRELRRQLVEARKQLAGRSPETVVEERVVEKVVEVPVLDGQVPELERAIAAMRDVAGDVIAAGEHVRAGAEAIATAITGWRQPERGGTRVRPDTPASAAPAPRVARDPRAARQQPEPARHPRPPANGGVRQEVGARQAQGDLTGSQQRVLYALAWLEAVGIAEPSRATLAPLARTRLTSGGFKNNLGALRSAGLISYPAEGRVTLTDAGRGVPEPPAIAPTDEALQDAVQDAVRAVVTGAQRAILDELIAAYPEPLERPDLAERVGVPVTSGGFKNNLGALRTLKLIGYPQSGCVVALRILFPSEGR